MDYNFSNVKVFETINESYTNIMNANVGVQVFEYIYSNDNRERLETYKKAMSRLSICTLPQSTNLLFNYYISQSFDLYIGTLYRGMKSFIKRTGVVDTQVDVFTKKMTNLVEHVYRTKLDTLKPVKNDYNLSNVKYNLEKTPYNEETFLNLANVSEISDNMTTYFDASCLKDIIESVLVNNGKYKIVNYRNDFVTMFMNVLNVDSFSMKNNSANKPTLVKISDMLNVYLSDVKINEPI